MNKWKVIAIMLIIIIFLTIGYFVISYNLTSSYQTGYNDGMYTLAVEQTTNGILVYVNQSGAIQSIAFEEMCGT